MIENVFGFPVYKINLSNEEYNKEQIISVIEKNYKKNKNRNNWDYNLFKKSNIHHSHSDENNIQFEKPNYSKLLPIYNNHILSYFQQLNCIKNLNYTFNIVNYTCMTKDQHMVSHIHPDCDFSAVHYIKFDNNSNDSTLFENEMPHSKFIKILRPNLLDKFSKKNSHNNWMYEYYKFNTNENDLIIFPSFLKHSIPIVTSKKTRITIAINITVN